MRVWVVGVLVFASVTLGWGSAHAAAPVTVLLYPVSVHLTRGTSGQTDAQAVPQVHTQDSTFYAIDSTSHRGVNGVGFTFVTDGAQRHTLDLTDQWNGEMTAPCDLRQSLWDFNARKWVGKTFPDTNSVPTTAISWDHVPRPNRFIHRGKMRGRITCTSKESAFTLSTDRIRLPDAYPFTG